MAPANAARGNHRVRLNHAALEDDALHAQPAMPADVDILRGIQALPVQVNDAVRIRAAHLHAVRQHAVLVDVNAAALVCRDMDRTASAAMHRRALADVNRVSVAFDMELRKMRRAVVAEDNRIAISADKERGRVNPAVCADNNAIIVSANKERLLIGSADHRLIADGHMVSLAQHANDAATQIALPAQRKGLFASPHIHHILLEVDIGNLKGIAPQLDSVFQPDDNTAKRRSTFDHSHQPMLD